MTTPLEKREVFHLLFLKGFVRSVPLDSFVLKGGSNLRFFFGSLRYSEDMDLDVDDLPVHVLAERVMALLGSPALSAAMRIHGVREVVPPDLEHAKQTETVQRFKVHLLTTANEDLFTKVEFSRRGFDSPYKAEAVDTQVLSRYRMPPLIVPHYAAEAAARQKVEALLSRRRPQARDIFDLWVLGTRVEPGVLKAGLTASEVEKARERIFSIELEEYRDAVVAYLSPDDQPTYESPALWDEIRLQVLTRLEGSS
jgi:predicted nucleotidyltransferase component of viral defense system